MPVITPEVDLRTPGDPLGNGMINTVTRTGTAVPGEAPGGTAVVRPTTGPVSPTATPNVVQTAPNNMPTGLNAPVAATVAQPGAVTTAQGGLAAPLNTNQTANATTYNASTAQGAGNIAAGTAQATNANAVTTNVRVPTDTVAGQIKGLIDDDSPLMQQAITRANQRMNERGLVNSTQAITAGQSALYDAALPIAQADAQIYNTERLTNQQAQNQAENLNAQQKTDIAKFNVSNAIQVAGINQEQANKMAQFNASLLTDTAKTNAMSETDMTKFLLDENLKAGIINQDQYNKMSQFNAEQVNKSALTQLQNSSDLAKFNASQSNELTKLGMDSQMKLQLVDIENRYKTLMNSQSSAADLYKQVVTNMANIMSNKDIPAEGKNDALYNQLTMLNNGLSLTSSMGSIGLTNLLNFTDLPRPGYSNYVGNNPVANTGPTPGVNTSAVSPIGQVRPGTTTGAPPGATPTGTTAPAGTTPTTPAPRPMPGTPLSVGGTTKVGEGPVAGLPPQGAINAPAVGSGGPPPNAGEAPRTTLAAPNTPAVAPVTLPPVTNGMANFSTLTGNQNWEQIDQQFKPWTADPNYNFADPDKNPVGDLDRFPRVKPAGDTGPGEGLQHILPSGQPNWAFLNAMQAWLNKNPDWNGRANGS